MAVKNTVYTFTVILAPPIEGGFTVTCEELPELVTKGHSEEEALLNTIDAFFTTIELYEDLGRTLPNSIRKKSAAELKQVVQKENVRRYFKRMESKFKGDK